MDAILRYIAEWLTLIANKIIEWLTDTYNFLTEWLNLAFQRLFAWFEETFKKVFNYIETVINGIKSYFNALLSSITDVVSKIWEKFEAMTTSVMNNITAYLSNLFSYIRTSINAIVGGAISWLNTIGNNVLSLINAGIDAIVALVETIQDKIIEWSDNTLQLIEDVYQQMLSRLNTALDTFLGGAGSFISAIESRLSQLKEAFGKMAVDIVGALSGVADETLAPIRDTLENMSQSFVEWITPKETSAIINEFTAATSGEMSAIQLRDFYRTLFARAVPDSPFWQGIFIILASVAGAVPLLLQVGGISAQMAVQEMAREIPYALFTPADVTGAWRRGLVSEDYAIDTIRRQGYTIENAHTILMLSERVPQEGDLLQLWHRGLLFEKPLDDAFHQLGYNKEFREGIKSASFLIPPISDLITMAVREAFSPEVAERFGQYEDYPSELTQWAEKQALSEDWSKRYWAAHWALPSPYQGFQMLHRGVINEEDLDLLLRALDVMPFWRDRLTKIAYTPFTRVDIRRMHKVGVLSEEDVLRSYKDIGYSKEKARLMTDFVVLLNAPPKADNEEELKSLSRSNIVGFYTDGLLTKNVARDLLIQLGYSTEAANLYLDSADLDTQRKERKDETNLILALTKAGILSFTDAEDRLNSLGLETQEVSKAITNLVREKQKTIRLPSRGEAEKMLKVGVISSEEYEELLEVMGYAPKWRKAYLAMAKRV